MNGYDLASIAYEANRKLCKIQGDATHPAWEDCLQWQRDSLATRVVFLRERPKATCQESHEEWLNSKLYAGWVYGEVQDLVKKTHPCCVPYDALPREQKVKEALFLAIVRALGMGHHETT